MAAVVGILGQEALGVTPAWYEAGLKDYGIPNNALLATEFPIIGFLELKRYQGFLETGTVSGERARGEAGAWRAGAEVAFVCRA